VAILAFLRSEGRFVIGNDIVDLDFVDWPPYHHIGHPERVCTPEELRSVREAQRPSVTLAALWASKEAAYKLFSRETDCPFVPREFAVNLGNSVRLNAPEAAIVIHAGIPVRVELSLTGDWLHATAISPTVQSVRWKVREIARGSSECRQPSDESRAARLLADELASRYCEEDMLQDFQGRIPILRYTNGSKAAVEVSFSHHGRFAAVAMGWPVANRQEAPSCRGFTGKTSPWEGTCSTCTA
jgi:phosphopantetheinyl transferase (holo-ACP synthase)